MKRKNNRNRRSHSHREQKVVSKATKVHYEALKQLIIKGDAQGVMRYAYDHNLATNIDDNSSKLMYICNQKDNGNSLLHIAAASKSPTILSDIIRVIFPSPLYRHRDYMVRPLIITKRDSKKRTILDVVKSRKHEGMVLGGAFPSDAFEIFNILRLLKNFYYKLTESSSKKPGAEFEIKAESQIDYVKTKEYVDELNNWVEHLNKLYLLQFYKKSILAVNRDNGSAVCMEEFNNLVKYLDDLHLLKYGSKLNAEKASAEYSEEEDEGEDDNYTVTRENFIALAKKITGRTLASHPQSIALEIKKRFNALLGTDIELYTQYGFTQVDSRYHDLNLFLQLDFTVEIIHRDCLAFNLLFPENKRFPREVTDLYKGVNRMYKKLISLAVSCKKALFSVRQRIYPLATRVFDEVCSKMYARIADNMLRVAVRSSSNCGVGLDYIIQQHINAYENAQTEETKCLCCYKVLYTCALQLRKAKNNSEIHNFVNAMTHNVNKVLLYLFRHKNIDYSVLFPMYEFSSIDQYGFLIDIIDGAIDFVDIERDDAVAVLGALQALLQRVSRAMCDILDRKKKSFNSEKGKNALKRVDLRSVHPSDSVDELAEGASSVLDLKKAKFLKSAAVKEEKCEAKILQAKDKLEKHKEIQVLNDLDDEEEEISGERQVKIKGQNRIKELKEREENKILFKEECHDEEELVEEEIVIEQGKSKNADELSGEKECVVNSAIKPFCKKEFTPNLLQQRNKIKKAVSLAKKEEKRPFTKIYPLKNFMLWKDGGDHMFVCMDKKAVRKKTRKKHEVYSEFRELMRDERKCRFVDNLNKPGFNVAPNGSVYAKLTKKRFGKFRLHADLATAEEVEVLKKKRKNQDPKLQKKLNREDVKVYILRTFRNH